MINKMKLALAGAVIATGMVSNAAYAATEQAQATVDVLAAVAITVDAPLDFGVVAASATGGTVTIGASAAATAAGTGVIAISGSSAGRFHVSQATNGETIDLTVGNPSSLTGPGAPIALSGLGLSTSSIVYSSTTPETVYVGGTISLNPNQTAGAYTGTFDVTAEYQ
ncbi:MAG: DUF4402 domain-containing protein [Sphingomonadales bacterium]|nr:DUF4402 domain-containing protein [Sphingomonadales bacterium]